MPNSLSNKPDLLKLLQSITEVFFAENILQVTENRGITGATREQLSARIATLLSAISDDITIDEETLSELTNTKPYADGPGISRTNRKKFTEDDLGGSMSSQSLEAGEERAEDNAESTGPQHTVTGGTEFEDDIQEKYKVTLKLFDIADDYVDRGRDALASHIYMRVAQYLIGYDRKYPEGDEIVYGVKSPGYRFLSEAIRPLVMGCCHGLASSVFMKTKGQDISNVLSWLYESELLVRNCRYSDFRGIPCYDWLQHTGVMLPPRTALAFIYCMIKKAEIFSAIGNSSSYQHHLNMAARYSLTLDRSGKFGEMMKPPPDLVATTDARLREHGEGFSHRRHPDPDSKQRYKILDPVLQVRGAWKKLPIPLDKIGEEIYDHSAFIWRGHLYVVKGRLPEALGKTEPSELRRLNLKKPDKWEHVTKIPRIGGAVCFNRVCVDRNKMYIFTGHPLIEVLDLTTIRWTTLKTTWKCTPADIQAGVDPIWPWPSKSCAETVQNIVNGHLYVFGGVHGKTLAGCDLFMKLNLKTLKWYRLSGTPQILPFQEDPHQPGPRHRGGSWIGQDNKKIYFFSGVCSRARLMPDDTYGPADDWMYNDLWSWDVETEKWREEKMRGNPASPRLGMGCVFSKKLNKAVVFGGVNHSCMNVLGTPSGSSFYSNYYADTFMWTPDQPEPTPKPVPAFWQQVQTVGFPTYRMCSHLLVDPDTHDVYLYGGSVAGDTFPSKRHTEAQRRQKRSKYETSLARAIARVPKAAEIAQDMGIDDLVGKTFTTQFGDLWRLRVDVPGGEFESVDMEDELRTAPLGPWQRCFECRKVGFWKKCGGSCSGKAFFCTVDCQSKGWKTHKEFHGCRKIGKSV